MYNKFINGMIIISKYISTIIPN